MLNGGGGGGTRMSALGRKDAERFIGAANSRATSASNKVLLAAADLMVLGVSSLCCKRSISYLIIRSATIALLFCAITITQASADDRTATEEFKCWLEGPLIKAAKAAIANPSARIDWEKHKTEGLKKSEFQTKDGRIIRGLVWRATHPRGYLLIAQGTSMLAAEIYTDFQEFSKIGLDVYIYDFRGYGRSDGNTALNALITDYSQRIAELNAQPRYKYRFLYGLSLGGIIFTTAIRQSHFNYSALILDSAPATIPWYAFCPSAFDPINNLPNTCKNWLVIWGSDDHVIGERGKKLLIKAKNECGANTIEEKSFDHIFTDNEANSLRRLGDAKKFMLQIMKGRRFSHAL